MIGGLERLEAIFNMTMVLGMAGSWFALMASDRLVTLAQGGKFAGPHDPLANKSVVFLSEDAVLAFGYTGPAYLEGIPTDQWIAQFLWGQPILPDKWGKIPSMRSGRRPGLCGVNRNLFALRKALAAVPAGGAVTIAAVGWRVRRRRMIPVLISFGGLSEKRGAASLTMRPPTARVHRELAVPQEPAPEVVAAVQAAAPLPPTTAPEYAEWAAALYTAAIRMTAKKLPTVGPHVMTVIIPRPHVRRIICRFEPARPHRILLATEYFQTRVPTAFAPWVVSDFGWSAAALMSGLNLTRKLGGWSVEFNGGTDDDRGDAPAFFGEQPRKPMPGLRRPRPA